MKKICFFFFLLATAVTLSAQNIGIGTTEPLNKLQVQGSILVTSPTRQRKPKLYQVLALSHFLIPTPPEGCTTLEALPETMVLI